MRALSTHPGRIELTDARTGQRRPIEAMTTLFDLVLVAVDADQFLPQQVRRCLNEIVRTMTGADTTVAVLAVGAQAADALDLADSIDLHCRVFADPEGRTAAALGLTATPGLVWVSTAPELLAVESGFDRRRWRDVLRAMARRWAWSQPVLPVDAPAIAGPLVVGDRSDLTPEEVIERDAAA